MRRMVLVPALALAIVGASLSAAADDSDTAIARIVKGTKNDAERAGKLLAAGELVEGNPKLAAALLAKAASYGTRGAGVRGAAGAEAARAGLEALGLLEKVAPDRKETWGKMRVEIYRRSYHFAGRADKLEAGRELMAALLVRADLLEEAGRWAEARRVLGEAGGLAVTLRSEKAKWIAARRGRATYFIDLVRQVEGLKRSVSSKPKNIPARRRLVHLLVVELDDPGEASRWLTEDLDETWRTYVPLAAKDPQELTGAVAAELAAWYHKSLAAKASKHAKARMLQGAVGYYARALGLYSGSEKGLAYLALKAAEQEVRKELQALGSAAVGRGSFLTLSLGKGVEMKLVLIPAGTFVMGSPESERGRDGDEGPQHKVTISRPFHMGVTEVTQEQYEAVTGKSPSKFKGLKNPVEQVSWNDAVDFCEKLSASTGRPVRLPTEAEWEYACRAGMRTRFSFGDDERQLADYAWYSGNSGGKTHPVGRKKPNKAGLYDMHGNVWELCLDRHGSEFYVKSERVDPRGPSGTAFAKRGGCWFFGSKGSRSADRYWSEPEKRDDNTGFRVVVPVGGR